MADGVKAWSTTAATNATADANINWAEGQAPSTVNDSARAMMQALKRWYNDFYGATTAGTSTAYTLTTNVGFDSLTEMSGAGFVVRFNATNGASPTLNVDGLGAKAIQTASGTAVATGAILANSVHYVCYDNSIPAFLLIGAYAPVFTGNVSVGGTLTTTGVADFADGTNSLPSITNTGDLNTGVYFPAADEVGVTVGGTLRAHVTATGLAVTGAITASTTIASTTSMTAGDGFEVTTGTVTLPADSVAAAALAAPAAWVVVDTQAASNSATINLTTGLGDTLYDAFCIVLSNVKPASDDVELWMRVGTGAGPTYQAGVADYSWAVTGAAASADVSDAAMGLSIAGAGNSNGNASGESASATIFFDNPEATNFPIFRGTVSYIDAGGALRGGAFNGAYLTAAAVTGIRFLFESGNIASGRFTLYGLTKVA